MGNELVLGMMEEMTTLWRATSRVDVAPRTLPFAMEGGQRLPSTDY